VPKRPRSGISENGILLSISTGIPEEINKKKDELTT
jgi:hypothetical protein